MSTADTKEPTMEEILASIRRIISEEGEPAEASKSPSQPGPATMPAEDTDFFEAADEEDVLELAEPEEVLELTEMFETPDAEPMMAKPMMTEELSMEREEVIAMPPPLSEPEAVETLVSNTTIEATTSALSSLSGILVRGYPGSENTLEGLVREIIRPMLKEWLDANLPDLVERIVAREISRISGRAK